MSTSEAIRAFNPTTSDNLVWGQNAAFRNDRLIWNFDKFRDRYFSLIGRAPGAWLQSKLHISACLLGLCDQLYEVVPSDLPTDEISRFGIVDWDVDRPSRSKFRMVEINQALANVYAPLCIPLVVFAFALFATAVAWIYGVAIAAPLSMLLLSVCYYATFLLASASASFRYFFPSFVLASAVACFLLEKIVRLATRR